MLSLILLHMWKHTGTLFEIVTVIIIFRRIGIGTPPLGKHTESSGGLWILIHSTDGPFTCRNLWKRFLKPSKSFLDTWKTQEQYLCFDLSNLGKNTFKWTVIWDCFESRPVGLSQPNLHHSALLHASQSSDWILILLFLVFRNVLKKGRFSMTGHTNHPPAASDSVQMKKPVGF